MEERAGRQTTPRLLIVEDDESQLRTLTAIMQEEGFDVIGCSTASEALEHLSHLETGVVVLDLRLPDLNGTQLLERLADVTNNIRVIINTAYSSYESARDALNFGAFAYVEKAGDPEELLRHVHRAFTASLRSYADQLETAVAERTRELRQMNELLNKKITEQEKTEKQRRQERDKAQKYLDVAAVMLVAIDSEERVGLINRKGCEILGYEEKEILGRNWFDNFLPKKIRDEVRAAFEKNIRAEADVSEYYENPILTKSGDERFIAWHNTILKDEKGNVVATLNSGEDITERKQAEKSLCESEGAFRRAQEVAHFGSWHLNLNTSQLVWSDETYRIFGVPIGRPLMEADFHSIVHPDDLFFVKKSWADALRGESYDIEHRIIVAGNVKWVHEKAQLELDAEGKPVLAIGTIQDITVRKKAEDKLREYQVKFKAMTFEILRTEERERKRIAIGLHDDICQNLVLTKVLLESTLRLVSDPSVSGPLKMACEAMSELIEQADSLTFELSNPILHQLGLVVALEKHLAEEVQQKHGIAFELESDEWLRIPDEEIKSALFRILRELLTNIIKYAQARNVKVSIHKRQSQLHIVIQDDGVGFDSKKVGSEVFRTKRFGLFSIREQLEHLGGSFTIESEPGRGTTATVVVPLGENTRG